MQALSDEREAAGIVVVGLEIPVVEVELIVVGLEVERILGGLPAFIARFHPQSLKK